MAQLQAKVPAERRICFKMVQLAPRCANQTIDSTLMETSSLQLFTWLRG